MTTLFKIQKSLLLFSPLFRHSRTKKNVAFFFVLLGTHWMGNILHFSVICCHHRHDIIIIMSKRLDFWTSYYSGNRIVLRWWWWQCVRQRQERKGGNDIDILFMLDNSPIPEYIPYTQFNPKNKAHHLQHVVYVFVGRFLFVIIGNMLAILSPPPSHSLSACSCDIFILSAFPFVAAITVNSGRDAETDSCINEYHVSAANIILLA